MKFLCPACDRLLELTAFRLDGSALVVSCVRCGAETRSVAAASDNLLPPLPLSVVRSETVPAQWPAGADPFQVPNGHCPKCISPHPAGATACATCGLTFANAQPDDYLPPESVAVLWQRLLSRWDDEAAHDQFLQAAVGQNELAAAGRLYRLRLAVAPTDAKASRGRDEVLRLATVSSAVMEKTPLDMPSVLRWQHLALIIFILLCAAVFFLLYRQFRPPEL